MTDISNEIRSEITSDGNLIISLEQVTKPEPKEGEVLIKVEASPINPSDLGLLLGPADVSSLKVSEGVAHMKVPEALMRSVEARIGQSLPVGNEGSGTVVEAGKDAEHLIGKMVGLAGGSMYSEYRCVKANACLEMNSTSVGFSGPSKRIDIMKSYGFSLKQADLLNAVIKSSSDVGAAWSHDAIKSSCIKRVFVCEEALGEISEGPDNYLPIWKRKMDACGASNPF